MSEQARAIVHLDLDAFYAAVEALTKLDPDDRNRRFDELLDIAALPGAKNNNRICNDRRPSLSVRVDKGLRLCCEH